MSTYVFKDSAPDRVRCMQCALYYPKDQVHKCPAEVKNVYYGDLEADFKAREKREP